MEPLYFHRGFTLIEMIVVFAIISILSTIVITSQNSFNRTLTLSNAAYDIALTLRSSQTFGLGSRTSGANDKAGYGIHLQRGTTNSFLLFSDTYPAAACTNPDCLPGDKAYTEDDTIVQTYELGNGITISDFCAEASGAWSCARDSLSSLDIVFLRPNPNVYMSKDGAYSDSFPVAVSCLSVSSPRGGSRFVTVGASGQIIANAASDLSSCHE